jgi:hypothetical protein
VTTPSAQLEPTLERTVAHLRAHVAELHRLEQARAAPAELEKRRELIARIQTASVVSNPEHAGFGRAAQA